MFKETSVRSNLLCILFLLTFSAFSQFRDSNQSNFSGNYDGYNDIRDNSTYNNMYDYRQSGSDVIRQYQSESYDRLKNDWDTHGINDYNSSRLFDNSRSLNTNNNYDTYNNITDFSNQDVGTSHHVPAQNFNTFNNNR